jgi:hypothetical protein
MSPHSIPEGFRMSTSRFSVRPLVGWPDAFRGFLQRETAKWMKVIQAAEVKAR